MKSQTIKAIFMNVLFVIGVLLLIFGFTRGALTLARIAVFEDYPLNSYEETRCELDYLTPVPARNADGSVEVQEASSSDKTTQMERQEKCKASLENQRSIKKVEDSVSSFSTFVAGAVLVYVFKKFIFK